MKEEFYEETIIVGGGLAGLGCARRLYANKHSFKIITPDIGGRVKVSLDGKVNYGAYYVTKDCKLIKPFMARNSITLVKGSRSIRLDELVERLRLSV